MTETSNHPFPRIDRPCPNWCTLPEGHGWDSSEPTESLISRGHGSTPKGQDGEWSVDLYLLEEATVPLVVTSEGSAWSEDEVGPSRYPFGTMVSIDAHAGVYTAAQACQIAAALLNAADQLDSAS